MIWINNEDEKRVARAAHNAYLSILKRRMRVATTTSKHYQTTKDNLTRDIATAKKLIATLQ